MKTIAAEAVRPSCEKCDDTGEVDFPFGEGKVNCIDCDASQIKAETVWVEPETCIPVDSIVITLDRFHYHEISDRCHLINSMIDDFVMGHPACNGQMTAWAEDAQRQLCNVMSMAASEEDKLIKL